MSNKLEWGFISKSHFSDSGIIDGDVIGLFNFLKIDECAEEFNSFQVLIPIECIGRIIYGGYTA